MLVATVLDENSAEFFTRAFLLDDMGRRSAIPEVRRPTTTPIPR
jgi:hypothetical protein